jgi:hypothetical protein
MAGLLRSVKSPQRQMSLVGFAVLDTAGTLSLESGATDGTITDQGTGVFDITFTQPFDRVPFVAVTPKEANAIGYIVKAETTALKCRITITEADGSTAEDASCDVIVLGSFASDEV